MICLSKSSIKQEGTEVRVRMYASTFLYILRKGRHAIYSSIVKNKNMLF